jgi:hypothetical protein
MFQKERLYCFSFLTLLLILVCLVNGFGKDRLQLLLELPRLNDRHVLCQDIFYTLDADKEVAIEIEWYHCGVDCQKVIFAQSKPVRLSASKNKLCLDYDKEWQKLILLPSFNRSIQVTNGLLPPGNYHCNVTIIAQNDTLSSLTFKKKIDSLIVSSTAFHTEILSLFRDAKLSQEKFVSGHNVSVLNEQRDQISRQIPKSKRKLEKYLGKKSILFTSTSSDNEEILSFYHEEFFLGVMKFNKESSVSNLLNNNKRKLQAFSYEVANSGLESIETLHSQFRKMEALQQSDNELVGDLYFSGNASNGQEPNAQQENQYYELGADLQFPVFGIPVQVTGFYTSQDKNRTVKASHFKLSYDASKAKEQLAELIGAFSNEYDKAKSKSASYGMVYQQYLHTLKNQRDGILRGMNSATKEDYASLTEDNLKQLLAEKLRDIEVKAKERADSSDNLAEAKAYADSLKLQVTHKYEQALAQYRKLKEYEEKISHYSSLLDQYAKMVQYDSIMTYSKVKDLKEIESMSAKDMAYKAGAVLPEGKYKTFLTGLTNLDVGMLNNYVSEYTQSGQMMKGIDLGYDIRIANIGASFGNTDYIGRSGDIEKYKVLGLRSIFKPIGKQNIGLIYYNYAPSKNMFKDTSFFKPDYFSISSFDKPTHILSLIYNGEIGKAIRTVGEYAFSNQKKEIESGINGISNLLLRSAYNFGIEASVPTLNLNVNGAFEYVGKEFENNTMPVLMAGIQRLKIGGEGVFFNSCLKLALDYNYLIQHNFTHTGRNSKWGFTAATQSKRYPSLSLSYKPFSTFRTFDDTLQIQQKPVLGEVLTGKLTYQIKRKSYSLRFSLIGNKNNSIVDTMKYGSTMLQLSTIYTRSKTQLSGNLAYASINTSMKEILLPAFNNSLNFGLGVTQNFKQVLFGANVDLGVNEGGLCKYGLGASAAYRFVNQPLSLRANCRIMQFKMNPGETWSNLTFANITANWQLKMKISN